MTYYIHPIWIYLIGAGEILQSLFIIFGILGIIISLVALAILHFDDGYDEDSEYTTEDQKLIWRLSKKGAIICTVMIILAILIPSKQTITEMMIANIMTKENISTSQEQIKDTVDYIIDKINEKSED